jgi:hypothetical protein
MCVPTVGDYRNDDLRLRRGFKACGLLEIHLRVLCHRLLQMLLL